VQEIGLLAQVLVDIPVIVQEEFTDGEKEVEPADGRASSRWQRVSTGMIAKAVAARHAAPRVGGSRFSDVFSRRWIRRSPPPKTAAIRGDYQASRTCFDAPEDPAEPAGLTSR